VIPSDLKWNNNKRKSFSELKNRLEAHIIQAGMNHMIEPLFVRRCKKHGMQALNHCKSTLDISKPQFLHDLDVLCGHLKSAFRTGTAVKHLQTCKMTVMESGHMTPLIKSLVWVATKMSSFSILK
jgi:hypothetical protein